MREAGAVSEKCDCAALALSCFRLDVDFKAFFYTFKQVSFQLLPAAFGHFAISAAVWVVFVFALGPDTWRKWRMHMGLRAVFLGNWSQWDASWWRLHLNPASLESFQITNTSCIICKTCDYCPPLLKADSVGEISYYLTCKEQKNKQKMHCTCQVFLATLRHKFANVIVST